MSTGFCAAANWQSSAIRNRAVVRMGAPELEHVA
jgi:hypothetical protein